MDTTIKGTVDKFDAGTGMASTGRSAPLGATVLPGGVNFSIYSRNATGMELLLFDREDDARPAQVIPIDPVKNRTYHYWHVFVPGAQRASFTPIARMGRSIPPAECGSTLRRSCLTLTAAAWWSRGITAVRPRPPGRQCRHGDEERGGGPAWLRLGRRPLLRHPSRAPSFTRCTCGASLAIPVPALSDEPRGHLCRLDREDSVPHAAWHHRRRTAAGVPVRHSGCSARGESITGDIRRFRFCAAPGLQLAPGPARPGRRISRHGEGAAPGGHRGDSRRRLQSHRRRRPTRANAMFPRSRQQHLLHS